MFDLMQNRYLFEKFGLKSMNNTIKCFFYVYIHLEVSLLYAEQKCV